MDPCLLCFPAGPLAEEHSALGRVGSQPPLTPQPSGTPFATLANRPLAALANIAAMTNQGKEYWKSLAQNANKLLEKVCPGSTQRDRDKFIGELETDKRRMGHLKKQRDKEGRSMSDTLKDWYRSWAVDQAKGGTSTSTSGKTRIRDDQLDEEGWTIHTKKPNKGAQQAPRGTSTAPSATSSTRAAATTTTTSTRSSPSTTRASGRKMENTLGDAWKDFELSDETPLIDAKSGEEAARLDPSDPVEAATGYWFCNSDQAAKMYAKFARAAHPVTFVLPLYDSDTVQDIKRALDKRRDSAGDKINPGVGETTLMVKEPTTGRKRNVAALLVHVDQDQPILPPHQIDDGTLFNEPLPSVNLALPDEVDLQFTVIAPICRELALTEWWDKLAAKPYPNFKDEIKRIITSSKFRPGELQARVDRRLTWRGEVMERSKITTLVRAPAEHAEELLARSGRHGIVIDRVNRGRTTTNDEYAKVKLPIEMTMTDALAKIDSLPAHLRKGARGVVPTARGYAIRVTKEAEADVLKHVSPEAAARLGPALGLQTSSSWVVHGVPRHADKQGIISALNAPNPRWRGWTVKPIRTLTQPRQGKVNWLVEAATDPPGRALTVKTAANPRGECVMIEKYVEEKRIAPKAASWFNSAMQNPKPDPIPKRGALWGDIAEEGDNEDSFNMYFADAHDHGDQRINEDSMDMDCPQDPSSFHASHHIGDQEANAPTIQRKGNSEAVERRMRAAGFRPVHSNPLLPVGNGSATTPTGAASMEVVGKDSNSEIMQVLRTLQESITNKDSMIQQLQETIKGLSAQIAAMAAAIASMQQMAGGAQLSVPQQRPPNAPGGTPMPASVEASAAS